MSKSASIEFKNQGQILRKRYNELETQQQQPKN